MVYYNLSYKDTVFGSLRDRSGYNVDSLVFRNEFSIYSSLHDIWDEYQFKSVCVFVFLCVCVSSIFLFDNRSLLLVDRSSSNLVVR